MKMHSNLWLECALELELTRFRGHPHACAGGAQAEPRIAIFSFVEDWYNPVRLHSAPGFIAPRSTTNGRCRRRQ